MIPVVVHHDWVWTFWNSIYPWAFFAFWGVLLIAMMIWPTKRH